ncbi:unnamed protein product [Paramecium octaurelia]|uniref:Uncharacterized protein n=1 Tax=Paramecium octaurelia TaxID=43137 RepID=A0A8S1XHD1_PAROT|nr:unnamed protein product [Paramecium octaurelia]
MNKSSCKQKFYYRTKGWVKQKQEIINVLKKILDHDFNKPNYSDEYEESIQSLITKISYDKRIIGFFILVHLSQIRDTYSVDQFSSSISCNESQFESTIIENIKIKNTSLIGVNFVRCDVSGSEFTMSILVEQIRVKPNYLIVNGGIQVQTKELSLMAILINSINNSLASYNHNKPILLWNVNTGKFHLYFQDGAIQNKCASLLIVLHQLLAAAKLWILWNLQTGKQMQNQQDIFYDALYFDYLLTASNQHQEVKIIVSVYGMLIQKIKCQLK